MYSRPNRKLIDEKFKRQNAPDPIGTLKRVDCELGNLLEHAALNVDWLDIFADLRAQVQSSIESEKCAESTTGKPVLVVICGSSKFVDIMAVCGWIIERDEMAIVMGLHLLPGWYSGEHIPDHLAEHEGVASDMDELHLRKIDIADQVFVVNHDDYIGDSTRREIEYAKDLGKPIRWFTHDDVGEKVGAILKRFLGTADLSGQ